MAPGATSVRERLASWWWDLPLRWKGSVVVALPMLALVTSIVAAGILTAQQAGSRAEARGAREAQATASAVRQGLVLLESAVLWREATGDQAATEQWGERRAELERRADELLERSADTVAPSAADAVTTARRAVSELERVLISGTGPAGAGDDERRSALLSARELTATALARLEALDAALAGDVDSTGDRIDRRSQEVIAVLVAGVVLAAVVAWVAMSLFTRSIGQRIANVGAVATRVVDGETEIGDLGEPAGDEIGTVIGQLRRAAELLILQNAELAESRDTERDRLEQERRLRDVIRRIHEAVGQSEVLAATVRELGLATDSDRALVLSVEHGGFGSVLAEWSAAGLTGLGVGWRFPTDEQRDVNVALVLGQRHAFAIDDVAASGLLPQTRDLLGGLDVGSFLLAPVVGDDEPLAALVLATSGRARPWPPGTERLAEVVAGDVATALTHARLYEREREMVHRLQELDQAKSDFVASVSHELRTPLTSICGFVEMLRDGDAGELTPEQAHMLRIVERNADRLLSLIEDLLTLARIESGTFRIVHEPLALGDVVVAVLSELRPQAASRGVELVADVAPGVPVVIGDASQMERVLLNLISNAVKFTVDGGRVVVRLGGDGDMVVLEVEDEGIGIPEGEQDRLFTRFFRSSTAQERAIQGTGLGLVIVKNIVEQHGGRIGVRSRPGVGTTFTVSVPAAADATLGVG